jgi:hypothetical protein
MAIISLGRLFTHDVQGGSFIIIERISGTNSMKEKSSCMVAKHFSKNIIDPRSYQDL